MAAPEDPGSCSFGNSLGETQLITLLDRGWEEKDPKRTLFLTLNIVIFPLSQERDFCFIFFLLQTLYLFTVENW